MSVTPDFIGQVYKDTSNGNLWRANSTTPGDWTLELQNMQVEWNPHSMKFGEKIGLFTFGDIPGLTKIECLAATAIQGFDFEYCDDLVEVNFPNLVSVDLLSAVGGYIKINNCDNLTQVRLPSLVMVSDLLYIFNNASITSLDLSSLQICGEIRLGGQSLLTNVDLSGLTLQYGGVSAVSCALTAASIEGILSVLVSLGPTYTGETIDFRSGTNAGLASLSAQGQADYATLAARPNTVRLNA